MENERHPHKIVTRPYNFERFGSNCGSVEEISVAKVASKKEFWSPDEFDETKLVPSEATKKLLDRYNDFFGNSKETKPNIFFHLIQKQNMDLLAPKVQIYKSDILLGSLNKDGFYRAVIEGSSPDYKKSKKYLKEIFRLCLGGVLQVKGIYSGYLVDQKR